jgi:lysophospholipase L1-like esterase
MASARARSLIRDTVAVAMILAGMVVAVEGAVRVFWPQNVRAEYDGGLSIAIPDDRLGHRLRPDARATIGGPEFTISYRVNGKGLRDEVEHALPKPEGTTRILVLGDSFAYGWGSVYDESWPVLFERRLLADGHPVEVVKAGVPGYDTRSEALYLEQIFSDYDPDIILLTFLPNDLFTNAPIDSVGGEPDEQVAVTQGRGGKGSDLHSLILAKRLLMANDRLYVRFYMLTNRLEYFTTPPSPTLRRQLEVTKALLERIQSFCRQRERDLVVLSIPQQFQVLVPEGADGLGVDVEAVDRVFAEFAREQGFTWLPALPQLRKEYAKGEDLYFRFDGHLNSSGNRAVADYLAAELVERFAERLHRPSPVPAGAV